MLKWGLIKFDDRELRNENETRKGGRIEGEKQRGRWKRSTMKTSQT